VGAGVSTSPRPPSPRSQPPRSGRVRRWPILLALVAVVVAAIVFRDRDASDQAAARVEATSAAGPSVPSADALSTTWYCAEGTSTPDGRADETVIVASVADNPVDATISVIPGDGASAGLSHTVRIDARGEARVRVGDLLETPEPFVIVEVAGGQAVVAHSVTGNDDVATEPCARSASGDWYFAGGTTLKGAQQFLVLLDPFGDDAIVDVTFLTDDGVQQPDDFQGLSVPRRSRVTIPVHEAVPRQRNVAIHVHARTGRVVAERSELFDGTASEGEIARRGIALSAGQETPRRTWQFADGTTGDGATAAIGVANFGSRPTTVEVGVLLEGGVGAATFAPQTVEVPARGVARVDVGSTIPAGTRYAVSVASRDAEGDGERVVAGILEWWSDSSSSTGTASTPGSSLLARRWVVALPSGDLDGVVTVVNPGTAAATAGLLVFEPGGTTGPTSAPERAIEAGRIGVFDLAAVGAASDRVVVVTSDQPVAVGVTYTGAAGAAIASAIPDFAPSAR
jgi:Family of unknown function (DUF5719)